MQSSLSIYLIIGILFIAGCKGGSSSSEEDHENTSIADKSMLLPEDPCQLAYQVISTLNEGPQKFRAATLTYDDFQRIKKDYPAIHKLYKLYKDLQDGTVDSNPVRWGSRFHESNPLLQLYIYEMEYSTEIPLRDKMNELVEDNYRATRDAAREEGIIWDEIRYNECELNRYFTLSDDTYEYADQTFKLPKMMFVDLSIVINGNAEVFRNLAVETPGGWKFVNVF
jgi:hypothetical protein